MDLFLQYFGRRGPRAEDRGRGPRVEKHKHPQVYSVFETFMTSICEKKISPEVRLIHAEQISL